MKPLLCRKSLFGLLYGDFDSNSFPPFVCFWLNVLNLFSSRTDSSLFKQLLIDLSLKEKLKLKIFKKVRLFTIFWLVHEVQHEQKQTQKNRKANLSDDGEGVNPPILHRHPYFDILFTLFLSPHLILPLDSSVSGSIKRFRHLNSLYPSESVRLARWALVQKMSGWMVRRVGRLMFCSNSCPTSSRHKFCHFSVKTRRHQTFQKVI